MSLKDIDIDYVYRSYGESSISEMINPILSESIFYKRSVGFFSSSSLNITAEGILNIVNSNGKIQILASPHISEDDKKAIELGYKYKDSVIKDSFIIDFENALSSMPEKNLCLLCELISSGFIDIKIVLTKGFGDYHDKFAIIGDSENNIVVFNGSANESKNGLKENYERIFVFKNWEKSGTVYVNDDLQEFDLLWNGKHPFNETYSLNKVA